MNETGIIRRETAISVAINTVLSAGFFLALFGLATAAPVRGVGGYAFDFLPQAFMVALMSSLVPGLLTSRRMKTGRKGAIVLRSVIVALLAAALLGGTAFALLYAVELDQIAPPVALGGKILFSAFETLLVTPRAVRHALASRPVEPGPAS